MKYIKGIIIIILLAISVTIIAMLIFGLRTSKYRIIRSFKESKELFENSIEELSNEECICIDKDGEIISIAIYEHIGDEENIIKVKQDDFYRYEQTINLMNTLKIESIDKVKENTAFLFSSSFYPGGKVIAYITDLGDYINRGNKIRERQEISGNWYYIVTESL